MTSTPDPSHQVLAEVLSEKAHNPSVLPLADMDQFMNDQIFEFWTSGGKQVGSDQDSISQGHGPGTGVPHPSHRRRCRQDRHRFGANRIDGLTQLGDVGVTEEFSGSRHLARDDIDQVGLADNHTRHLVTRDPLLDLL